MSVSVLSGPKVAVVTGVLGQDGSYLSEYLISLGYNVIGIARRQSTGPNTKNIEHLLEPETESFRLIYGDITDYTFLSRVLHDYAPSEWYGLAAESHVGYSFKNPVYAFRTNAEAVIAQLELIRQISPYTRFYNAATSELFGGLNCPETGYTEESQFNPRSPYAVAKLAAFYATKNYREAYGIYACSGILHNHSSPRRGGDFATRKITRGVAEIKLGMREKIQMGNLSAFRDEGHSKDYCRAMHLMLQQDKPEDFLISTGKGATIEDMFKYVCGLVGLEFEDVYEKDQRFMRPSDVPFLLGNPSKAKEKLGWEPEYTWKKLLREMLVKDALEMKTEDVIVGNMIDGSVRIFKPKTD